ncbi:MAG TPA: DNA polymerase/3'-5' exonuclease PolX [Acidimicrobiia bacterium]|nr:DNA polymerase/3'-5' exonuclease PolX [Acidimicrobiia bacterium]
MIGNGDIATLLYELARLTTLEDGSPQSFRVRAYEKAARAVETATEPVAELSQSALTKVGGIGSSTAKKIRELADSGSIAKLEALRERYPPAFVEITRIPGVGPKTALAVREQLGVETVEDLKAALDAEKLRDIPGLGARTEENIRRSIERLGIGGKDRRTPVIEAMRTARDVLAALRQVDGVERVEYMGSLRRFRETIGDIDIIAVTSGDADTVMDRFVHLPVVREVVAFGGRKSAIISSSGLQIDLRVVEPHQFGAAAIYFTGSKAHNIVLRQMAIDRGWTLNEYALSDAGTGEVIASETEEEVYGALGLAWVPPTIREDAGEFELAADDALRAFAAEGDLRGDLHVHTDESGDGRDSITAMLDACVERGYAYVAITDHGEDLAINGLSRERMLGQRSVIEALRERYDLEILHGVELNIGPEGTIDYDAGFLAGFDFGVASVHSHFDLDAATETARVIAAMENPAVNVIGHLTGRMIGRRPGIELDIGAVLDAAARTGCALEINSHLDRLDAPAEVLRLAREREDVLFAISTDAHEVAELANSRWGVLQAQRGWVPKDRIVNTWPADRFLEWAAAKRMG